MGDGGELRTIESGKPESEPRLLQVIPAGLIDAGFASIATFIVGLFAARYLSTAGLGVYAITFRAFMLAHVVPDQLIFVPVEVEAARHPLSDRSAFPREAVRRAAPLLALFALVPIAVVGFLPGGGSTAWALAITAGAATATSPPQDHVRRSLHLAGLSWRASAVSVVHLVSLLGTLSLLWLSDIAPAWIPFGSLAMANAISLTVGLFLTRYRIESSFTPRLKTRVLLRSGGWVASSTVVTSAAALLAAVVVAAIAGREALGHAEAARIVAAPVLVFGAGISAVLGPRVLSAAAAFSRGLARHYMGLFGMLVAVAALGYTAIAGFDTPWNPMQILIPKAYVVSGLVLITIWANALVLISILMRSQMLGTGSHRALVPNALVGGFAFGGVALAAGSLGAFAMPIGESAQASVRLVGYSGTLKTVYAARE